MIRVINNPPKFVRRIMSNYLWKIGGQEKKIYLTFDDGPTPDVTEQVLDMLLKYNAKATFFCLARNIEHYPEIYQRIINEGHSVGNHTYSHLNGWKVSFDEYINDIDLAAQFVNSKFFRPPYGRFTKKQITEVQKKGYKIVLWDVMPEDYNPNVKPEDCCNCVLKYTTEGSIITFHDSLKGSRNLLYSLPLVLEHFAQKGYDFVALTPDCAL